MTTMLTADPEQEEAAAKRRSRLGGSRPSKRPISFAIDHFTPHAPRRTGRLCRGPSRTSTKRARIARTQAKEFQPSSVFAEDRRPAETSAALDGSSSLARAGTTRPSDNHRTMLVTLPSPQIARQVGSRDRRVIDELARSAEHRIAATSVWRKRHACSIVKPNLIFYDDAVRTRRRSRSCESFTEAATSRGTCSKREASLDAHAIRAGVRLTDAYV